MQGGYSVVSCDTCGTGFANVYDQNVFYRTYYREHAKYATEVIDEWSRQRASVAADRIEQRVPSDAFILDIGCGNGALVKELQQRGHQARGIEIGDSIGETDVACLAGVLEHVWDPAELLSSVPAKIIYIEVPDASSYCDPYLAPFEDFNTEHINHFSSASLEWLAARCGFKTRSSQRIAVQMAPDRPATYLSALWERRERDDDLVAGLNRYAGRSGEDLAALNVNLENALASYDKYTIWGAGETAFKLLALPALQKRKLVAIADSNPARQTLRFNGFSVRAPKDLPSDCPVVVASSLRQDAIAQAAHELGIAGRLIVPTTEDGR